MSIQTVLIGLAGKLAKVSLASLGFGILTFGAVTTAFNTVLTLFQNNYSGLGSNLLAFLEIGGFTSGFEIIVGAIVAVMAINVVRKLGLLA